jgi:hypothetical protein
MYKVKNQQGMALVAVILTSAFILLAVVATASMASYGGRLGTRNERLSYQALLSAESGMNSFATRVKNLSSSQHYHGTLTKDALNAWLTTNNLASLDMGTQGSANLSVVAVDTVKETMTLQSTGNLSGMIGTKKVLIDISMYRALISPKVSAALTSYVPISFNGNTSAGGLDGSLSLGAYDITTAVTNITLPVAPKPQSFKLEVANAALINPGDYLQMDSHSYKVLDKVDNTLSLRSVTAVSGSPRTIASGSNVGLILSATASKVTGTTFPVSDVSQFNVHDTIYMGSYEAKVTAIDTTLGTLSVSWVGFSPNNSSPVLEGTPIRRYVFGALSAGEITIQGSSIITPSSSANDTLRLPSKATMFETTFGMTETEFLNLSGLINTTATPDVIEGLTYVNGNWNGTSICGKGIVVVTGDARINTTCASGFQGLLYVKGAYNSAGNAIIQGAIVVEGESSTNIRGTGEPLKIEYDPAVLLEVGKSLSPWSFKPVAGSWRLK